MLRKMYTAPSEPAVTVQTRVGFGLDQMLYVLPIGLMTTHVIQREFVVVTTPKIIHPSFVHIKLWTDATIMVVRIQNGTMRLQCRYLVPIQILVTDGVMNGMMFHDHVQDFDNSIVMILYKSLKVLRTSS